MAVWQPIKSQNLSRGLRFDPEFYQPKYLEIEKTLLSFCNNKISDYTKLSTTHFEPAKVKKFNYIEISDVKLDTGDVDFKFIDTSQTPDRAQFLMQGGEILVSTVRPNRSAIGLLPLGYHNFVVSSGFAPLKSINKDLRPFLFIWLKNELVTEWLTRCSTASMYPAVTVQDILDSPVFAPREGLLITINEKVKDLEKLIEQSNKLYPEAEQELLERMEWDKVKAEHILDYTATSKDIMGDERLDPEFYQPKFENLEKHLKKIGAMKVDDVCNFVNHGIQPPYFEDGKVAVITQKEMTPTFLELESVKDFTSESFYGENPDFQLRKRDVLLYSVGAYIGRCNILLDEVKAMAGSFITILRANEKLIAPEYLSLFLNSQAGIMQSKQRMRGTAQHYLYPRDIKEISVFIPRDKSGKPDLAWQKKLAEKVIAANEAKKSAKQKLQEAKKLVEKEVETMLAK